MPRTYNATQESVIRGGYVPFLLKRDIDQASLKGAVQELNATNRAAIQQKNVIMEALAKADLNPADAAWRDAYAQQIESELQKEVIGGSYAKALPTAMELAGKVASNPELMARQKANKEYQVHKGVVDNMVAAGKLPQRIADQWMEENPYKFDAVKDKNGRVIGAKEWRPNWNVVAPIDMSQVYSEVGRLAAEEAGGSQNVRFVDENGNTVANPSNGMYSMEIKTNSQWHRLPTSKLKAMFNAVLDQIPGARETFEQDYNNKLWQFSKVDDEGKKAFYGSDIIDNQGVKRTLDEYIAYKSDPIFNGMAYNRVHSTVDYNLNSSYMQAKAAAGVGGNGIDDFIKTLRTGNTSNLSEINIPLDKELQEHFKGTNAALKAITDIFNSKSNTKGLINNPVFNVMFEDYITKGDYNTLAKYIENLSAKGFTPQEKAQLDAAIRRLKVEGNAYNSIISGMDEDDVKTLNTYAALTTGAPFLNAKNNKYAQDIAYRKNKLFSYQDNKGKVKYSDKMGLEFIDDVTLNNFINKLNYDRNDLSSHGLHIVRRNGKIILDVDKTTDLLPSIGEALQQMDNDARYSWGFNKNFGKNKINIVKYDNKGNLLSNEPIRTKQNVLRGNVPVKGTPNYINKFFSNNYEKDRTILKDFSPTSDYSTNLEAKVQNILMSYNKTMRITPQVLGDKSFTGRMIKDNAEKFGLTRTDVMAYDKDIAEDDRNLVITGLSHIKDFRTYDENGNPVSPKDAENLQEYLNSAIADNKFVPLPVLIPGSTKGYGWSITIPEFKDKGGDVQKGKTILVEGLIEDIAAKYLSQSEDIMNTRDYQIARSLNNIAYDIYGNRIKYDYGENEQVERNKYIANKRLEEAYTDIDIAVANNIKLDPQALSITAYKVVAQDLGISGTQFDKALNSGKVNELIQTNFKQSDIAKAKTIEAQLNNKYIELLTSK